MAFIKAPPQQFPAAETLDRPMVIMLDEYLSEFRFSTIIEGWKVRDLLLDLRNLADLFEGP